MKLKSPGLLPILIIIVMLMIIGALEYFKWNVSLFDFMSFLGLIDAEQVHQYKELESSNLTKSQEWTPSDIISLIGTIGQILVGLIGSMVTYTVAKRN